MAAEAVGPLPGARSAAAAAASPAMLEWCLLPYFAWQFFHYQKQNAGLAALAASASRVPSVRPAERRALLVAGGAGIAGLVAHPGLLQLRIDPGLRFICGPHPGNICHDHERAR